MWLQKYVHFFNLGNNQRSDIKILSREGNSLTKIEHYEKAMVKLANNHINKFNSEMKNKSRKTLRINKKVLQNKNYLINFF